MTTVPATTLGRVGQAGRDLLDLVLPLTCAGCGLPCHRLCPACAAHWWPVPRRCEHGAGRLDLMDGAGPLPVWALAENVGTMRATVVAWKDRGRAELTGWLTGAVRRAAPALLTVPGPLSGPEGVVPDAPTTDGLLVVPAPSSPAGARRRGEDLVAHLARAVAQGLSDGGAPARSHRCLRLVGHGRDQVGLGLRGRAANLSGRTRLRPGAVKHLPGTRVLLVDDVLTTGATLAACRRVLTAAGARVLGAVVLAVTPPPGAGASWLEPDLRQRYG